MNKLFIFAIIFVLLYGCDEKNINNPLSHPFVCEIRNTDMETLRDSCLWTLGTDPEFHTMMAENIQEQNDSVITAAFHPNNPVFHYNIREEFHKTANGIQVMIFILNMHDTKAVDSTGLISTGASWLPHSLYKKYYDQVDNGSLYKNFTIVRADWK